jgi:hypothetical protein
MTVDASKFRWRKSSYSQVNGACVEVGFLDAAPWRKSSYSKLNGNCVEVAVVDDDPAWHTSSYSKANGECVEVAVGARVVAVRDTKDDGRGPILVVSPEAWAAFVGAARGGEFGVV